MKTAALALSLALASGVATAGRAQSTASEAARQSGDMESRTPGAAAAANGVGTAGSLTQDHGTASSTVLAPKPGSPAPAPGVGSGGNSGGTLESDPALGGSKKPG